jgi:SAM-dependent methyltransferase
MTLKPYALDNDHTKAADHHNALADILDPVTIARLRDLRPDWSGATCLEVGAGAGSIARYLADQVSPNGLAVALDIKPQHIQPHPRLRVVQHDLTSEEPLPDGPFDLIHARLILQHLPARDAILRRLADALAPGGVLLTEDWEALITGVVIAAPSSEAADLFARFQQVLGPKVFAVAGSDRNWARRANLAMRRAGLVEVETTVSAAFWPSGSPGCKLVEAITYELEAPLVDAGFSRDDLSKLRPLLADPRLVLHGHPLYSTSGWRPIDRPAAEPTWSSVFEPEPSARH